MAFPQAKLHLESVLEAENLDFHKELWGMFDKYVLVLIQKKEYWEYFTFYPTHLTRGGKTPKTSVLAAMTSGCLLLFIPKLSWQVYQNCKNVYFFPQRKPGTLGRQCREFAYLPRAKATLHLKTFLRLVISSNQIAQTLDVRERHCFCVWRITPAEKIFPVCSQLDAARVGSRADDTVLL